jgi:NADH-ubiquinone oxidoreductase chain 6
VTLIGVKSKYGSCNGNCTGCIILKILNIFFIFCRQLSTLSSLGFVGSNPTGINLIYLLSYLIMIDYLLIYMISSLTNIYFLPDESFGFLTLFLDVIFILSILSGIFIIISKNPIVSVLYLIMLFSCISCYLIFLGINFIGLSYLLVYVGAVSILFLFILMLINIRVSELISNTNNNIPLAILAFIALFVPYNNLSTSTKINFNYNFFDVLFVSSNNWDSNLVDIIDIASIGNVMYTNYSIWLLITSVILLLAMVGSIVITIKQKY